LSLGKEFGIYRVVSNTSGDPKSEGRKIHHLALIENGRGVVVVLSRAPRGKKERGCVSNSAMIFCHIWLTDTGSLVQVEVQTAGA